MQVAEAAAVLSATPRREGLASMPARVASTSGDVAGFASLMEDDTDTGLLLNNTAGRGGRGRG
eukprot:2632970-Pyramimonas_sp.AAC.1